MADKAGVIYVRVGIKDGYDKLIPSEVDDLNFSFKHKLISHSESLAFALNPDYAEYALYLEMDLYKDDVENVVSNMVVENNSDVRDGLNVFEVIKHSTDYPSIFD